MRKRNKQNNSNKRRYAILYKTWNGNDIDTKHTHTHTDAETPLAHQTAKRALNKNSMPSKMYITRKTGVTLIGILNFRLLLSLAVLHMAHTAACVYCVGLLCFSYTSSDVHIIIIWLCVSRNTQYEQPGSCNIMCNVCSVCAVCVCVVFGECVEWFGLFSSFAYLFVCLSFTCCCHVPFGHRSPSIRFRSESGPHPSLFVCVLLLLFVPAFPFQSACCVFPVIHSYHFPVVAAAEVRGFHSLSHKHTYTHTHCFIYHHPPISSYIVIVAHFAFLVYIPINRIPYKMCYAIR